MKNTKEQILDSAHTLFNTFGVASVSLRQIAKSIDISHGNLRYHFKTKEKILESLHGRLLEIALKRNQEFKNEPGTISGLINANYYGFHTLCQFRYFMNDFNAIMRDYPAVHRTIIEVKAIRAEMYRDAIKKAIKQKQMKPESYPGEYENLIERIRIFSDFWISSAMIYDKKTDIEIIIKYVRLFISMLYPHLTTKGKQLVLPALTTDDWWERYDDPDFTKPAQ